MVAHRVIIRGGNGDATAAATKQTQTISGNHTLDCEYVVLTSVIVQLRKTGAEIANKASMKTPVSGETIPSLGCYGISIRFPESVCPSQATHHSGAENEADTNNRLDVHFSQDTKTFFYKPNVIMHNVKFAPEYNIELFSIDCPHEPLDATTLVDIHSITLNFTCEVTSLMLA